MDAGLGQLGFWVFLGLIIAASIVSEGLKHRDNERERQATLRALLEKDGKSATEVLAYMRERDAAVVAEAARARARSRATRKRFMKRLAVALGIFAIAFGIWAFLAVHQGLMHGEGSIVLPLVALLGIWAAGLTIAWLMWRSGTQKHDVHADA
jgi:cytochrome bd-type quinol oxidase subunit 2